MSVWYNEVCNEIKLLPFHPDFEFEILGFTWIYVGEFI